MGIKYPIKQIKMKKLLIAVAIVLGIMTTQARVNYVNGKFVYVEDSTSTKKTTATRLPDYPVKDKSGKITFYPCYMSSRGSIYIVKISKKGNEYKAYLSKDEQSNIKKQLNIK